MRKKQANSIERHPKQYAKQRKDFTEEEVAYYTRTFNEKNKYMSSEFKELTPKEFYRSIFPEGTFEQFNNMSEHNHLPSIVILRYRNNLKLFLCRNIINTCLTLHPPSYYLLHL